MNSDRISLGFDREDMPSVTSLDIYHAVQWMFADDPVELRSSALLWFYNSSYGFPSEAQLHEAIGALDTWQMHYVLGLLTCYDFTHAARGELAAMGLGKTTIGEVELIVFDANHTALGRHDCLIAGTSDGGRYFIEPQQQGEAAFHSVDDPVTWIFPTATSADIVLLMF